MRIWMALVRVFALVVSVIIGYSAAYEITRPSNRVIARWQSPSGIPYDGPKCLMVVEGATELPHLILTSHLKRYHYVYVGRACDQPGYGHTVSFEPCCYQVVESDAYWRDADVRWTMEGVTLTLKQSGHRLFIPARAFVGGR